MPTSYTNPIYNEPGVSVKENVNTNVIPLISTSDAICLIGPSSGSVTTSEIIQLSGTTTYTLQNLPSDATFTASNISAITAIDANKAQLNNPSAKVVGDVALNATTINISDGTNFPSSGAFTIYINGDAIAVTSRSSNALTVTATTAAYSNGAAVTTYDPTAGYSTTSGNSVTIDATNRTITRVVAAVTGQLTAGRKPVVVDGEYVQVTYSYVPKDFWNIQKFDNMSDVENKFGSKFNASKTAINSPLSFAAQLAFENGASSVMIQPLFYSSDGGATKREPTNSEISDINRTWNPTLDSLKNYEGISVIVPVIGQTSAATIGTKDGFESSNGVWNVGTLTQTGSSVTLANQTGGSESYYTNFVGKTLVYADGSTNTITAAASATSLTTSKSLTTAISSAQTFKILTSEVSDETVKNIFLACQNFVDGDLRDNGQYHIIVCGEDGTDSTIIYATKSSIQNHAQIIQSAYADSTGISKYAENMILLSTSKFTRPLPNGTSTKLNLGGQYAAAAIAGMLVSRKVSDTLTRKNITGFDTVIDTSTSRKSKTDDSARGLFVVEQKGYAVQVRHALTLNTKSVDKSELSVVRAKHKVINSLRYTIDSQIIGKIVADNNATLIVGSAIGGVLSTMVDDGDIVGFSDVQAKMLNLNPTIIEVRFAYRPAFPVNYVNVVFSIDLTNGDLTSGEITNQINSGVING
jgi:hypothetical protein